MSQTALPAPQTRRRVFFGLFNADGWAWATVKALFWFVVIILMLGYIPDRAYYFTVQRTVDLGLLLSPQAGLLTPVNLCPASNETLPCPAPAGAVLPWHPAPEQVHLPAGRTDGVAAALGSTYVYVGGTDGSVATDTVYVSHPVGTGNIDAWAEGPPLPEPRADAASVAVGTSLYVIGGRDAAGAPTTTVFSLTVQADGSMGEWKTEDKVALPAPRAGASAATVSNGIVLMGGADENGPTRSVWKSVLSAQGALQPWKEQAPLLEENVDGGAVHVGEVIFLVGGSNASGPVATVQQGLVGGPNAPEDDPQAITAMWRASAQTNLPAPRTNLSVFTANGSIYAVGGSDGSAPQPQMWWAKPDADGIIPQWSNLPATDLGQGVEGSSAFVAGPYAFLVGGTTADGVTGDIARANLAPQEPFFQLGVAGVVVPALQLQGEVGQQIGYLNAAGVGTVNFVILLLIGYLYAHPQKVRAFMDRRRNRKR